MNNRYSDKLWVISIKTNPIHFEKFIPFYEKGQDLNMSGQVVENNMSENHVFLFLSELKSHD